ncbi:hypothetical protein V6Z12_A03G245300 [Gossypium hirsutum]|uniref:DUF7792 domain-containing protein n=2 Tax=Gossypium TaxID=3633 RepID=A0A5D2RAZ9_GOSTO|nr:hypothetical protein ES288_A03G258500v1 [Gossypium darwinii]TYI37969.1 hypothetical protein ES332_A03G253100v1 [Gossypium tomentosum]
MALCSYAQQLFDLMLFGEDVSLAINESNSFKVECGELGKRVSRLLELLCDLLITTAPTSLYLRPINCMVAKLKRHFEAARRIVCNCKHRNLIWRLFVSRIAAEFEELFHVLDASIGEMEWVVRIYEAQTRGGCLKTEDRMSPTVSVWSCIATVEMGSSLDDRIEAVNHLASLVRHKDEYKHIIVEEGGVDSLMKLLKENCSLVTHIAAANTLCLLANEDSEGTIMNEMISTFIKSLSKASPISKQMQAADLVASIAERNPELKQHNLIREDIIWQLVILLSSEQSTLELKISCSKALWKLAQGSVSNCRTLTETKGMLCLAKLVAKEQGELRYNCIMIIKEITFIAESDDGFRRSAFTSSSLAAKAVVDELLRVIKELDDTKLGVPAIKSIGSLARSFSAKQSRVIGPLVARLGNTDQDVAMEAAIALKKFVSTDNYLRSEHSKSIIEFEGVPLLMKLLISGDKNTHPHVLELICYLAQHDSNSNVLIKAGALTALQTIAPKVNTEYKELETLVPRTISKLQSNLTVEQHQTESSTGIKQFFTEQSKAVVATIEGRLKLLYKRLTVYLQRLVRNPRKRILGAIPPLKTTRIQQFLKAKCMELALMSVYYLKKRLVIKEPAQKLRLVVRKFVISLEKKEIRRNFGYIIHKLYENVLSKKKKKKMSENVCTYRQLI